jgi:redox-sensitive bicupin YhaK (pirin superfamily)
MVKDPLLPAPCTLGAGAGPNSESGGAELVESRVLLAPEDGSLGPLLRLADDRLGPGRGYGRHAHADVDVVAVLLDGSLRHAWGREAVLGPGDVAVLRAGRGLEHDEIAGAGGAHVVQTYLRAASPGVTPAHDVLLRPAGWVELGRPDARLWLGEAGADVPAGLRVVVRDGVVTAESGEGPVAGPARVVVWQLDVARPTWAD